METPKVEKLSQFFEQVKALTFWRRLFRWSQFRSLSYEAYEEFKFLLSQISQLCQDTIQAKTDVSILKNDNEHLKSANSTLDNEAKMLKSKFDESIARISDLTAQLATRDETLRQVEAKQKQLEIELFTSRETINQ